ncbi:hypothetical protein DNL40_01975 [Xylanimonas oleitrophica]|uniref:CueP family metal-binding protein n=1 Tax=Xylanimonas oleitrophica TaxID=2607479 RepID=A0A2W5WV47_9MICO|nr:CueP family metal-binding protein [Xylanimonas oleitrophica]PZR55167.1 hypothetical protein DNL40_01975 [Xylanimonas oleitrophica]
MRNRSPFAAAVLAATLAAASLAACTTQPPAEQATAPGGDVKQLIAQLEDSSDARPLAGYQGVSVGEEELTVVDAGGAESRLALPADERYVSVAPYVDRTHECYFHNLATCRGELTDTEITVTFTDDDGQVLLQETARTAANGFAGFWLPQDVSGTITVEHDGRTGQVPFETAPGSPTCITTLRLA